MEHDKMKEIKSIAGIGHQYTTYGIQCLILITCRPFLKKQTHFQNRSNEDKSIFCND